MNARQTIIQHLPLALLAAAILLGLGAAGAAGYTLMLHHRVSQALEAPVQDAVATPTPPPQNRELPEATKALLKEKPVFGQEPRQEPQLQAILGSSALISGQWIDEGKEQGPFKLIKVDVYTVEVVADGTTRTLSLWPDLPGSGEGRRPDAPPAESGHSRSGHSRSGEPRSDNPDKSERKEEKAEMKEQKRSFGNFTPEQIDQFRQKAGTMTQEQRDQFRAKIEEMQQRRQESMR